MKKFFLIFLIFLYNKSFAVDSYGAIVADPKTGKTVVALNYDSVQQAERLALKKCNNQIKRGKCIVAVGGFANSCAAVAWSPNKKNVRGGWHDNNLKRAEVAALERCKKIDGLDANCQITKSGCTSWETWETTSTLIWW